MKLNTLLLGLHLRSISAAEKQKYIHTLPSHKHMQLSLGAMSGCLISGVRVAPFPFWFLFYGFCREIWRQAECYLPCITRCAECSQRHRLPRSTNYGMAYCALCFEHCEGRPVVCKLCMESRTRRDRVLCKDNEAVLCCVKHKKRLCTVTSCITPTVWI